MITTVCIRIEGICEGLNKIQSNLFYIIYFRLDHLFQQQEDLKFVIDVLKFRPNCWQIKIITQNLSIYFN